MGKKKQVKSEYDLVLKVKLCHVHKEVLSFYATKTIEGISRVYLISLLGQSKDCLECKWSIGEEDGTSERKQK